MTAYRELIKLLEKATGPDRELDLSLQNEFLPHRDGWKYRWGAQAAFPGTTYCAVLDFGEISAEEERESFEHYRDQDAAMIAVPLYTASIDAAVSLVEKVRGQKGEWTLHGNGSASVHGKWPQARTDAATPSLALCLCLLRALEAQSKDKEEGEA